MCLNDRHSSCSRQGGFSLVTAIFILVILATLGAFMVTFSTAQQSTVAMDIQSARALQAARAGIEWGAYETLKVPGFACPVYPAAPQVYSLSFSGSTLSGFSTTVSCNSSTHTEGANSVVLYLLTSVASYGSVNTPDYVSRQITTRIASCYEPDGVTKC